MHSLLASPFQGNLSSLPVPGPDIYAGLIGRSFVQVIGADLGGWAIENVSVSHPLGSNRFGGQSRHCPR